MTSRILLATAAVGLLISSAAIAATVTTTAPVAAMTAPAGKTVLDLTDGNSEFSTLAKAIKAAGLESALTANGPITVFAPTNAAFAKLGPAKLNELMNPANKAELTQILTYHVVPQALPNVPTAQVTSLTTDEGQSINVTHQAIGYQVQNARSLGVPMGASNGSIIAIDSVLLPDAQAKMATTPSVPGNPTAAPPATGPAPTPVSSMTPPAMAPAAPTTPIPAMAPSITTPAAPSVPASTK